MVERKSRFPRNLQRRQRRATSLLSLLTLFACHALLATEPASRLAATPQQARVEVRQLQRRAVTRGTVVINEYVLPDGSGPSGITTARDGALWFTMAGRDRVGRLTTDGALTEIWIPLSWPGGIAADATEGVWVTLDRRNQIALVRGQSYTAYTVPTANAGLGGIAQASDGSVWFTEYAADKVARLAPSTGTIEEFPLPMGPAGPAGLVIAQDGRLWVSEVRRDAIVVIDPSGQVVREYLRPFASRPASLTFGPDGAVWFCATGAGLGYGNYIGRLMLDGSVTEYPIPTPDSGPAGITRGPDGALWFAETFGKKIARLSLGGQLSEFPYSGVRGAWPQQLCTGPDGNIWMTTRGDAIAQLIVATTPVQLQQFTAE